MDKAFFWAIVALCAWGFLIPIIVSIAIEWNNRKKGGSDGL